MVGFGVDGGRELVLEVGEVLGHREEQVGQAAMLWRKSFWIFFSEIVAGLSPRPGEVVGAVRDCASSAQKSRTNAQQSTSASLLRIRPRGTWLRSASVTLIACRKCEHERFQPAAAVAPRSLCPRASLVSILTHLGKAVTPTLRTSAT